MKGTGTSLKVETLQQKVKLAPLDEEKVSNIVEVCNVSREEALRVLDACHMDETMAIERFLSGNEISTWSQVSKKKKPPSQPRSNSGSRGTYGHGRAQDRDRDRDRDRRDRDRSHHQSEPSSNSNGYRRGPRQHHPSSYGQRPRDQNVGTAKKRAQSADVPHAHSVPIEASVPMPEQTQSWGTPAQEEPWRDPSVVNGANGESWADSHTSPSDAWSEANPPPTIPETSESTWVDAAKSTSVNSSGAWGAKPPIPDAAETQLPTKTVENDSSNVSMASPHFTEAQKMPIPPSSSTVKRTFNYAAAAAAGTSHEKPAQVPTDRSPMTLKPSSVMKTVEAEAPVAEAIDGIVAIDASDAKKRRNRGGRKPRGRLDGERPTMDPNAERTLPSTEASKSEAFESQANTTSQSPGGVLLETTTPQPSAWGTATVASERKEEKHLDDSSTAVAVASAAVTGTDQTAGDSLSLQFGSFGLSGLDGVNWSASEQETADIGNSAIASTKNTAVPQAAAISPPRTSAAAISPVNGIPASNAVGISTAPLPSSGLDVPKPLPSAQDVRNHVQSSTTELPSATSGGTGMFPVLPVGPGGSFPPPNYGAPYMMPPLHGYSPAMPSYENGGDLGSNRGPNLAPPGSLPLYDPGTLSNMASGTGKFAGIPGLGEMSGMQGVHGGAPKDSLQSTSSEMDKNNSISSSGLPAGMDPLAAPYMMPGYPSVQYPMYTFPTGPYAPPPGMAPPGPSPFPYPGAGQIPSQGARGGFGFEDGSGGLGANSRSAAGLGESMYTPGGYLNASMPHSSNQKTAADGSYKQVRSSAGTGLSGVGMGGGMVHGMTYGDFSGAVPGVSSGVPAGGGPGSWNSRQGNTGRNESGNPVGGVSNQSMGGASQNSSVYAAGPGAPGGYWGPQQGGYYP